jgi:hypothetical protein
MALILMAMVAASIVAVRATSSRALPPARVVRSSSRTVEEPQSVVTALSANSCMAASCHGGPVKGDADAWKSSYTAWFTRDPHANAYNDLFNARSRRMIAALEMGASKFGGKAVAEDARGQSYLVALSQHGCLACHAATTAGSSDPLAATSLGCHDCHGPDQGWVAEHYLARWQQRAVDRRRRSGMTDTQSLAGRAQVCVGCHIGASANEHGPLRDMNHDLIAAGHPRLNFEFAAYLANLPPHWSEEKDHQRLANAHDNVEAAKWIVGQQVCATAAAGLLADRARRADDASQRGVWPEFAEYDCYGCHHQLASPSTRPAGDRRPGQWQWGSWHFALRDAEGGDLASLKQVVERTLPDAAEVARLASQMQLSDSSDKPGSMLATLTERLSMAETDSWHWDEWTQWYLGLRAWLGAMEESQGRNSLDAAAKRRMSQLLEQLEAKLKFSRHADSPWGFDATDPELRKMADQILDLLPAGQKADARSM